MMKKNRNKSLPGGLCILKSQIMMKLTVVLLLVSSLGAVAQNVTVKMKNSSFIQVAKEIQKQTELTFLYNDAKVGGIVGLNPDFTNADVKAVLEFCLKGSGLSFSIVDNTVVISPARQAQQQDDKLRISGKVTDERGLPLPGVNILIKGTTLGYISDVEGNYTAVCAKGDTLLFSMIGFESQIRAVNDEKPMNVKMKESIESLDEVVVVSTGYSRLPKERATGSFSVVTAKELEKRPSPNILNRLEGVVPGVYVDVKKSDMTFLYGSNRQDGQLEEQSNISMNIRGKSSFSDAMTRPLLVVDGFPTDLELKNLNPNDVESITFLKDAAAASIWGARAANGVIVIETKKGKKSGKPGTTINFGMNVMTSASPRFSTLPVMTSAEMIDYEREMVDKGYITRPVSSAWGAGYAISTAAKLLLDAKDGVISQDVANAELEKLASRSAYRDVKKYLLQSSFSQQYNLSFSGASEQMSYFLSASYANERSNTKGNNGDRFTLTSNLNFKLMNWATLTTGIRASLLNIKDNGLGLSSMQASLGILPLMPYDQLVDDNGNRVDYYRYDEVFVKEREALGYQSWRYNYLDELDNKDNTRKEQAVALTMGLNIPVPGVKGLALDGSFMYEKTNNKVRNYENENTYAARDRYNYATRYDESTGTLTHGLPGGALLNVAHTDARNYSLRGQLNYDNTIAEIHQVSALAGIEFRETRTWQNGAYYYGYNEQTLLAASQIQNPYTNIWGWNSYLLDGSPETDYQRRFLSYYGNLSYTLMNKYVVTGSVRYDDYNNFGVDRKYRATPMWSTGLSWHIGREDFIQDNVGWLNQLTFRTTYGYNGNIDQNQYPFTQISLTTGNDGYTQLPSSSINFAANPSVRWEKTGVLNFGLDFAVLNHRLSGTIELYRKYSRDLFADYQINPIFGANASSSYTLSRNAAKVNGKGIDLALNGTIVQRKDFTYRANLTFSYNSNEVKSSPYEMSSYFYSSGGGSASMLEGYSMSNFWAYRWAGLDENGDALVYNADGEIIKSTENVTNDDLVYMGTLTPKYFGGFFNTFSYKGLSLYVGITYKFGHIFQKPTIAQQAGGRNTYYEINEDMAKRWRVAGDEETTDVPRIGTNANSFTRYRGADIHVLKGDHIRLREVALTYDIPSRWLNKLMINSGSIGFTATNLGLIWKKNNAGIDPDFIPNSRNLTMAPTPSYNFSLNLNF